ncbi:hypothetical protein MKW94_000155 [Papaver nudicaule]|uniref:protein-serine/threonine phosphatase n=1 Tax=Papaver nudicaule TaxID=74823 RepID=A0AA41RRK9_PAPNU|nr:hypothetical protein [Papaver nudicaule]
MENLLPGTSSSSSAAECFPPDTKTDNSGSGSSRIISSMVSTKKKKSSLSPSNSNKTLNPTPSTTTVKVGGASSSSRNRNDDVSRVLCSSYGSVSVCGRRREMEDAVTVEPGFISTDFIRFDFFAVYDGHGGSKVAQACRNRLHQLLAKEIEDIEQQLIELNLNDNPVLTYKRTDGERDHEDELDWESIMSSCFNKMDEEINGSGIENEEEENNNTDQTESGSGSGSGSGSSMKTIGSTAVVAILGKGKLVVANCGDSRAVLSRGGAAAIPLSRDHKPDRPDELERVEAAGGRVIDWNGYRVLGVLATSRSIGDFYLKPYVTSEPEVTVMERTTNDDFLILASDGLWDVMTNETACEVVRKCLEGRTLVRRSAMSVNRNNSGEAAAVLAELAMARGSKDNISVVVVELKRSS